MKKVWKVVFPIALVLIIAGAIAMAGAAFAGGTPSAIAGSGLLSGFFARLEINWNVFLSQLTSLLG